MSEIAIGIDLGTSNSCVAVQRAGNVEVLPNAYGEPITASVVELRKDGSIAVGNAARANIIHDPKHTISSSKRLMGRYYFSEEVKKAQAICSYEIAEGPNHGVRINVRDELFSPPEIGAMVLREIKAVAEARLGEPVSQAVITVPANFNDNQRQATKDAGRIAGLEVLRILNEPTAAALAYGFGKGLSQQVAIYDLGGGTFDISVLEIGHDVFEVLSTCGDTFLGGDDFDDRLIDLLADEFMEKEGINLRNDPFALEKLKVAAEAAKKELSIAEESDVRIPDIVSAPDGSSSLSLERTVTAGEFETLVHDLIQRTFKVCDEALQQAGVIARDLDGVMLVGGPTRLPVIHNAVREYFQQDPRTDVDPDQVVAMGAAIHAATLVDIENKAFLLDVTPLSLKIGVAGGLAETIIERNTPVPIEQTRTFTTFQDDQETVVIRVCQGESRDLSENELLGQFEFSGFKKARRGDVNIDVTFEINEDGIVNVTARDPETGQATSTCITLSSGLSEGEMREIIEQNRTERVESATPEDAEVLGAVDLVARPLNSVPKTRGLCNDSETGAGEPAGAAIDASSGAADALDSEVSTSASDALDIEVSTSASDALDIEVSTSAADTLDIDASAADMDYLGLLPDEEVDLLALGETGEIPLEIDSPGPSAAPGLDPALAETQPDGNLFGEVGTDLSETAGDNLEKA